MPCVRNFDSRSLGRAVALALALALAAAGPGNVALAQTCPAPLTAVALVNPTVLGNGTPGSVSQTALQNALNAGGHILLNVGAAPSTITLSSELIVTRAALLDGAGVVTLSGNNTQRVLRVKGAVLAGNAYTFTLQNITVANGRSSPGLPRGAGLLAGQTGDGNEDFRAVDLVVINSRFENNQAAVTGQDDGGGAIYANGARSVAIGNSNFVNNRGSNGGAVYTLAATTVDILDSSFDANVATGLDGNPGNGGNGGAIGVDGQPRTVRLCRTRVQNNQSGAYGAGFFSVTYGPPSFTLFDTTSFTGNNSTAVDKLAGGAYVQDGPFAIRNSLFADNQANGYAGLFVVGNAPGEIVNSTFTGNLARHALGGGLVVNSNLAVAITNTTIANNRAEGGDCCFAGGMIGNANVTFKNVVLANNTGTNPFVPWNYWGAAGTNAGGNLQFPATRPNGGSEPAMAIGTTFANPQLQALAANGGFTQTLALLPGTPAVNAGVAAGAPSTDQRGLPRDAQPDAGAFELQPDLIFANGFQ